MESSGRLPSKVNGLPGANSEIPLMEILSNGPTYNGILLVIKLADTLPTVRRASERIGDLQIAPHDIHLKCPVSSKL